MRKIILLAILQTVVCFFNLKAQSNIPLGISLDSIIVESFHGTIYNIQSFHCYKPSTYDPALSPVVFAIHGSGGDGLSIINDLIDIAERRHALIIAPNFPGSGYQTVSRHQEPIYSYLDHDKPCVFYGSSTEIIGFIYKQVLFKENRSYIPAFLIGFSAGAQFVSRYMWMRQAYPDSIPFKMAVASNAYSYSLPTDTFQGVPMPWLCGSIMPTQFSISDCFDVGKLYSWNCNEHIIQYYNENLGILIGTADVSPLGGLGCFPLTGANRFERAQNFYNFADTNAVNRGTTLNWQYKEVQGVAHDEYAMFNNKANPNDSSTIAETLLFDTPYNQVNFTSPIASFYANVTEVEINDTVNFINTSANATTYFWDFGDSLTSQDANPFHIYSSPGYYAVQLTVLNTNGCDNWAVKNYYIHVTDPTGIHEANNNHTLSIYPNPASETCTFSLNPEKKYSIEIIDAKGKLIENISVINENQYRMNFKSSTYTSGVYFVKCISNDSVNIQKLIIAR